MNSIDLVFSIRELRLLILSYLIDKNKYNNTENNYYCRTCIDSIKDKINILILFIAVKLYFINIR